MPYNKTFETKLIHKLTQIEDRVETLALTLAEHLKVTERLDHSVDRIDHQLEKNTDSLIEHMRRTALLEGEIEARVTPVEKHIAEVSAVLKFLKAVVVLLGVVATIVAILKGFGII